MTMFDTIIGIEERAEHGERLARIALAKRTEFLNPIEAGDVATHGLAGVLATLAKHTDPGESQSVMEDAQQTLDRAAESGIRYVIPGDAEWPTQLAALNGITHNQHTGAPLGLWLRGQRLDVSKSVAVVGSRSATSYGTGVAVDLSCALAERGSTIVSGAAFGIDVAAHRGALAGGGSTVAVLACGVDRAYPSAHAALLDRIADVGTVVSEYAPGAAPMRLRFLARNRILAAMTRGTVVVEAATRSGSLNTAAWASKIGRPLMAVPGPVTSAPSEGCHDLIKSGVARMVTHSSDVFTQIHQHDHN